MAIAKNLCTAFFLVALSNGTMQPQVKPQLQINLQVLREAYLVRIVRYVNNYEYDSLVYFRGYVWQNLINETLY
jgi:hypothetical protein